MFVWDKVTLRAGLRGRIGTFKFANRKVSFRRNLMLCLCGVAYCLSSSELQSSSKPVSKDSAPPSVAMVVDGGAISVSELCAAIATLPTPQAQGYPLHPALAAQWYGPIVALATEAKREGIHQDPPAGTVHGSANENSQQPVNQQNGLAEKLVQKLALDVHPSQSQIEKYYATHQDQFARTQARHIVISDARVFASKSQRTPEEAKHKADQIYAQLRQGASFAALAAAESDDPYTKNKGGDLGELSHLQMEPAVDRVVWSLAPGQTSPPFEGRFGYEIVQVEARRILPLDTVRQIVVGDIKLAASMRRQQEIVTAAHITLNPVYQSSPLPCAANPVRLSKNASAH